MNFYHYNIYLFISSNTFKNDFIYLFLERGEGRKKDMERNINVLLPLMHPPLGIWPATQLCALTGNWTGSRLVRRPTLNPPTHTSQGSNNTFCLYFSISKAISAFWIGIYIGYIFLSFYLNFLYSYIVIFFVNTI